MKIWVLAILAMIIPSSAMATDALDWATGSWGVDVENIPEDLDAEAMDERRGCRTSPVVITADRETLRYKAIHTGEDNFTATAPILKVRKKSISLQYDDETRLMKNGEPHIWHMVFVNPDKFYWVLGTDIYRGQREGTISVARVRCRFAGV
jgi:hypothetical protein